MITPSDRSRFGRPRGIDVGMFREDLASVICNIANDNLSTPATIARAWQAPMPLEPPVTSAILEDSKPI
jgi:hypothetical protein